MAKLSNGCPTTNVYVLLSTAICEDCQYSNMWGLSVQQYVRTVSTAIWEHYSVQWYGDTTQYSDMGTLLSTAIFLLSTAMCVKLATSAPTDIWWCYSDMGTLLSTAIWGHYSVQRYGNTTQYSDMGTLLSTAIYGHYSLQQYFYSVQQCVSSWLHLHPLTSDDATGRRTHLL